MKVLNYGTRHLFTKDYVTKTKNYKLGTVCNILNNVVVLGHEGEFLFDVDSELARKFGTAVK